MGDFDIVDDDMDQTLALDDDDMDQTLDLDDDDVASDSDEFSDDESSDDFGGGSVKYVEAEPEGNGIYTFMLLLSIVAYGIAIAFIMKELKVYCDSTQFPF